MRLLAFSAVRLDLAQDQVLFREGAKASSGFVVSSGGLQLTVGEGQKKKVVANCEIGSLVGELALLIKTKRPSTATAMVSSQVLELDRKLIIRMLNEYPAHRAQAPRHARRPAGGDGDRARPRARGAERHRPPRAALARP